MPAAPSFLARLFPHPSLLTVPAVALLMLFALACFLPGFFTLPPTDRDESRFAQASKQMVETGDLVDIHFQEETRHKKPVGIYWLQAGAVRALETLTGRNLETSIWAYRLPSLAGALLSVWLTALIGARLFNAQTGMAAGLLLASCFMLNAEARLAKTDAMLLASILACQMVLAKAYMRAGYAVVLKTRDAVLFWLALSIGILIKGPIILLPVGGTLLALRLMKEPLGWLRHLRPLMGLGLTLALVLPWFILITLKTHGAFYNESAGHDLLAKIWEGQNWGGAPPGFYLTAVWATLWPASLPLMLALPWVWTLRREPVMRFLAAWILPGWLVFELILTKLIHYTLPFFPALVLLAAAWLMRDPRNEAPPQGRAQLWFFAVLIIWAGVALGFALVPAALPALTEARLDGWQMFIVSLVLAGSLAALTLIQQGADTQKLALLPLAGAGFAMAISLFGMALPGMPSVFLSSQIARHLAPAAGCPRMQVVTAGYNEPSLVFLAGADTKFLEDGARVADALAAGPCRVGVVDKEQLSAFRARGAERRLAAESLVLRGFNYGRGRAVELHLYRPGPAHSGR